MSRRLLCLDIDGTLTDGIGGPALAGALVAVAALRRQAVLRFVTNATSRPHAVIAACLQQQRLLQDECELITPATVARSVLTSRDAAAGILLAPPAARGQYDWFREDGAGPTVLLADEGHGLTVADLQPAFRLLLSGAELVALQQNRYFRRGEDLVTDLGPLAAFLSYASGRPVINLGKPSRLMFESAAASAGVTLDGAVMVGDDAEFDASGAVSRGLAGVLVRTGKYRPGDERRHIPAPTAVLGSVADLPAWLESHHKETS